MKKRVLLICGVAILLLLLGCMTFFLITKGRNYSADGLELNDRVYISSIYIENETVHYTVVNQSCRRLSVGSQPVVEKKVDGVWQTAYYWNLKPANGMRISPFSRIERDFSIGQLIDDPVGEYRLRFSGGQSIVGYFSVTEEMRGEFTDYRIYQHDGMRCSELIRLKEINFENEMLYLVACNDLDKKVSFSGTMLIQKKEGEEWINYHLESYSGIDLAAHAESDRRVSIGALAAGEYRCILAVSPGVSLLLIADGERTFVPSPDETYAIGYFTVA